MSLCVYMCVCNLILLSLLSVNNTDGSAEEKHSEGCSNYERSRGTINQGIIKIACWISAKCIKGIKEFKMLNM